MQPTLVPLEEAIATTGVSRPTLYRWAERGLINKYDSPTAGDRRPHFNLKEIELARQLTSRGPKAGRNQ